VSATIESPEYQELATALKRLTMSWARGDQMDWPQVAEKRRKLLQLNHRHYFANIPIYQRLCARENLNETADFAQISNRLLLADDLFKSYPQNLIDTRDFAGMNAWLSQISAQRVEFDTSTITTIDEWLEALEEHDLHLVFSSGTSGQMSFVPRDPRTWNAFMELPYLYLPQIFARHRILNRAKAFLVKTLAKWLSPDRFLSLIKRFGMRDMQGFFMNFSGGNQGIQLVGQEAAKLTGSAHFLYMSRLSPSAVRAIVRGPRTDAERELIQDFLRQTVHHKDGNYERIISDLEGAATNGEKVMLFGTPYLIKELCEKVWLKQGKLQLPKGSHVLYGGGWKSFDGKRIPESELLALIANTFGISRSSIFEGYSMTEINGLMAKCEANRYHVPPYLETLILSEELTPQTGGQSVGTLAILDPFATSYPGFLMTGDNVQLHRDRCPCGLEGDTILQVERAPGREVKGCGGIMASVNA
jgi:hypothetical protein